MTDKVDPVEILLERREELRVGAKSSKLSISEHTAHVTMYSDALATTTAQIVVIDAALAKLGYIDEDKRPPV